MKQNEEEVQYYYDSSADQWWCFDNRLQCWVPWKEEESEDAEHPEDTVAPASLGEATANGAVSSDEAVRQDATGSTAVISNTQENAADTSELLTVSGEHGDTEAAGERRSSFASRTADSAASHATKSAEAENSATTGSAAAASVVATVEKGSNYRGNLKEIEGPVEPNVLPTTAAPFRSEATEAADVNRISTTRQVAGVTARRSASGVALTAADEEKQQQLPKDSTEENVTENKEKGEGNNTSIHEVDPLRSALESLATSRCLDQALMQIRTSGSLNRILPSTRGGGASPGQIDETENTGSAGRVDQLSSAESKKVLGLHGINLSRNVDEEHTAVEEEDEDDQDVVGELPDIVKPDPIVRRSTRMLTFKDKGGLAGCLREAARQRNDMIKEAGGYIPGTEEYREEAWKQRARALASQTHARTRNKWKEAARRVYDASGGKASQDKVMHFADLVERVRRKSEGDGEAKHADADLSRFATYSLGSLSTVPSKSTTRVDPDIVAANLLLKPDVDLREQRRRSSGFTGGQQGHVRFADAAFRDPNSQLQMQDLLTQQSRRKVTPRKEDATTLVEHARKEQSGEQAESVE